MDKNKIQMLKAGICDRLCQIDPADLGKPTMVEYAKNLASMHNKLCKMCEDEEGEEYSNRSMRGGSYRDGIEWGAYGDGMSMRRGRDSMGRYASYGYSETGGSAKEQLRRLMEDPNISREDREELRRTMDRMHG